MSTSSTDQPEAEKTLLHHQLNDGFVTLKQVRQDGEDFLHFYVELNTRHPADLIWEQLVLGLTDSDKSWLWPLEFERCPEPPAGGPQPGCICKMTYKVPRFDNPEIPAKAVTYSYRWPQFDPERRLLEYRSLDHPLQGGAVVQVIPLEHGRSQLRWDGSYQHDPSAKIVVQSMTHYIPLLYDTIEALIEAGPERFQAKSG